MNEMYGKVTDLNKCKHSDLGYHLTVFTTLCLLTNVGIILDS